MLLPVALWAGLGAELARATPLELACCAYLGIFGTGLGFTWYYEGILRFGASRAGVFINLVPVNAVAMGWLLLGEGVDLSLLFGTALILTGVWLVNKPSSPPQQPRGQGMRRRANAPSASWASSALAGARGASGLQPSVLLPHQPGLVVACYQYPSSAFVG
jgi:hypothetical protein